MDDRPSRQRPARRTGFALLSLLMAGSLLAQGPETIMQPSGILDVRQHGAIGDGTTLDTDAINRTIAAAADRGGGTVYFPAGTYLTFSIRLRSNITLHLGPGATLLAADPAEHAGRYDPAEPTTTCIRISGTAIGGTA